MRHGKKANASIVLNHLKGRMHYPVVGFLTDKQEWITQELRTGYRPAKREGTKLEIIYDPNDVTRIEIFSFFNLHVLPILLIVIGAIGLLIGIFSILGL
ncbi:hypothetical protein GCM10027299_58620 [Larkinella ripae]